MSQLSEQVSIEIVDRLAALESPSRNDVNRIKIAVCKKYSSPFVPPNSEILQFLPKDQESRLRRLLTGKLVRSVSGVVTVAVMPKPWGCPHGKCTYCPGGPDVGVPRAYTGQEPAVMRALEAGYDPYRQVASRMAQLRAMGHPVDKVELILIGGTFPFMPQKYQEDFVKNCLDALNRKSSATLADAKNTAEAANIKNVGITVETRPDWSRKEHVDHMLSMGVTRVEIGVQTVYDDVYRRIHRDHTVADVAGATQTLRDSCLKVGYHMMLGLPGCDHQRDLNAFHQIFDNPEFKPDMLKIYPCLVTSGTELYQEWKAGSYKPYSTHEAATLIAEVKQFIPPWVRVMRIQREIPVDGIADGVMNGNLRQLVQEQLSRQGTRCRCIRCREVGQHALKDKLSFDRDQIRLVRFEYPASGGIEIFLSFEENEMDILIGYLRLRIPSDKSHRPEIFHEDASLVRELHVLGTAVPVGARNEQAYQHKGYGAKLLAEAERISFEEYDRKKILVISALGTKNYYRRFEYVKDGPYMSKCLDAAA